MQKRLITFENIVNNELGLQSFKESLKESNGCVRIFIHPTATPLSGSCFGLSEVGQKPIDLLERVITAPVTKKTPVIIFEDQGETDVLHTCINRLQFTRDIFLCETEYDDPEPLIGWLETRRLLARLGVRKIILSGLYLFIREKKGISGCIWGAYLHLAETFEVELSHFVYPLPRKVFYEKV